MIVDAKATQIKLRVAKDREKLAWANEVPQLRFGRLVLRNVDAYILRARSRRHRRPHWRGAFAGYRVQLDTDRCTDGRRREVKRCDQPPRAV